MIVAIDGKIERQESTYIHINCNGLVHEVFISVNCSSAISGTNVRLYTTQIIREDANILYGFLDSSEKLMFDTLIKINGVGPKVAMAICSTYTPTTFSTIITSNDITSLKRVPGIGPKSAGRILVELSGFSISVTNIDSNNERSDAALALESLGYKKDHINRVLKSISASSTSQIVKEALRSLQ